MRYLALIVAAAIVMAACAAATEDPGGSSAPSQTTSTLQPPPGSEPVLAGPVGAAVRDLAQRLGVAPEDVVVVSRDEVTWRDGSLGCPQPGMSYTQALVDGARIILEVGGVRYEYHSGGTRAPFWCETADRVAPEPPVDD